MLNPIHDAESRWSPHSDPDDDYPTSAVASRRLYKRSTLVEEGWPKPLLSAAFIGLAGDFVRTIEPHSESDTCALLLQFLTAAGSVIGRGPYMEVEASRHYTNLFCVLVGQSSKARKGTSWNHVRKVLTLAEPEWASRVAQGLSTGEGLIYAIRDANEMTVAGRRVPDPGETDKRLLTCESEFASVLRTMERDGNTLSAILRQAWDGVALRTITKTSVNRCEHPHVSVIGHITKDELLRYLNRTETANGLGNRFLWACVRRSKELPFGGNLAEDRISKLAARAKEVVTAARGRELVTMDAEAKALWVEQYSRLTADRRGILGSITGRADPQTLRLALLYALLDQAPCVQVAHLRAALEVWRYCAESCAFIFGDSLGDQDADRILAAIRDAEDGLTRTQISDLFHRNLPAARLDRALAILESGRYITGIKCETGGRAADLWFSCRLA